MDAYYTTDKDNKVADTGIAVQELERTGEVSVSSNTTIKKDGDPDGDSAGDTIDYTILLTNNGTTTLSNITVTSAQLLEQVQRY